MPIQVDEHTETITRIMPLWKVLIHNDDVHTFDDVIEAIKKTFKFDFMKALKITEEVHETGVGLVQIEPKELAELHRDQLQTYGLSVTIEPEN